MSSIHPNYNIIQDDITRWANTYNGPPFHASLLDPPYHLTSITKRFGKPNSAPAKVGVYNRASKGFMGTSWDGTDESGKGIAFEPETWAALAQHHYPGAFIMAYAGTRGYHRMACAMEDAGLIIHPATGFIFGSGFPKATRIDTQIDKAAGAEREVIGRKRRDAGSKSNHAFERSREIEFDITASATPLAQTWEGHRYGLQALKPAFEFIAVAQVPYLDRPIDSIVSTGAGALNIDAARIPTEDSIGRWPANFLLHHSPGCNGKCVPGCPVKSLDEQSGNLTSGGPAKGRDNIDRFWTGKKGIADNPETYNGGDSGGASRFFFRGDWNYEVLEQIEESSPVYISKPSTAEREAGLDGQSTRIQNDHPTVKSISLNKYLASLLLPPEAYAPRRILVPFAGVGSEMIGAILAGWESVTGIEQSPHYVDIARARLAWWSQWPGWGQTDVDKILATREPGEGQLKLFEESL